MIVLFIIAFGLAMTIVFMVGFWAGRLTERSKWKKQQHVEAKRLFDMLYMGDRPCKTSSSEPGCA
jgi:hypothetical protein